MLVCTSVSIGFVYKCFLLYGASACVVPTTCYQLFCYYFDLCAPNSGYGVLILANFGLYCTTFTLCWRCNFASTFALLFAGICHNEQLRAMRRLWMAVVMSELPPSSHSCLLTFYCSNIFERVCLPLLPISHTVRLAGTIFSPKLFPSNIGLARTFCHTGSLKLWYGSTACGAYPTHWHYHLGIAWNMVLPVPCNKTMSL